MKKFFSILLAMVMTFSLFATAFAAEPAVDSNNENNATMYNVVLNSDGIVSVSDENGDIVPLSDGESDIMPLSSISGYNKANLTSSSHGFLVWVDASGIGGMGVTVKTTCSTWKNGTITFNLVANTGANPIKDAHISSNGETKWNNLLHGSPAYFLADFSGIPSGHTVTAEVWIYG